MKLQSLLSALITFLFVVSVASAAEHNANSINYTNDDGAIAQEQGHANATETASDAPQEDEEGSSVASTEEPAATSTGDEGGALAEPQVISEIADPEDAGKVSSSGFDAEETGDSSSPEATSEEAGLAGHAAGADALLETSDTDKSGDEEVVPLDGVSADEDAAVETASEGFDKVPLDETLDAQDDMVEVTGDAKEGEGPLDEAPETRESIVEVNKHSDEGGNVEAPLDETPDFQEDVSTTAEVSGDEAGTGSDDEASDAEKEQDETKESLIVYDYEVPLKLACETKKLICHNVSSSNAITIQGSRKGSALFASFDASEIRNSGLNSGDVASAKLMLNKIGGSRTLPARVDVLNLESNSSRISKSTVLATFQVVLPKTQNSPVSVDITSAIHELLERAKDQDKFSVLVSAYSKTRFGDILTFPTKDYPNGLSLKLKVTKLPEDSSLEQSKPEKPAKEIQSLKERIFSGVNLYVAVGILATVVVIVTVLMIM